jgi:hypothetical protein
MRPATGSHVGARPSEPSAINVGATRRFGGRSNTSLTKYEFYETNWLGKRRRTYTPRRMQLLSSRLVQPLGSVGQ